MQMREFINNIKSFIEFTEDLAKALLIASSLIALGNELSNVLFDNYKMYDFSLALISNLLISCSFGVIYILIQDLFFDQCVVFTWNFNRFQLFIAMVFSLSGYAYLINSVLNTMQIYF